jgi:lipoate-protein ligase A
VTIERAPAAALLARADDWLEQTRADGELRAGWSRATDAVLVLGSAQRVSAPGPWLRRSTGGGAVSCDDRYLMFDIVLPRGHPLVIDDVGQS